jgi:hypothetical protein
MTEAVETANEHNATLKEHNAALQMHLMEQHALAQEQLQYQNYLHSTSDNFRRWKESRGSRHSTDL